MRYSLKEVLMIWAAVWSFFAPFFLSGLWIGTGWKRKRRAVFYSGLLLSIAYLFFLNYIFSGDTPSEKFELRSSIVLILLPISYVIIPAIGIREAWKSKNRGLWGCLAITAGLAYIGFILGWGRII